ncbi:carcinine transporter isoform X3 [Nasonia vitripennis]|uniref:Major facilitator superfamily (MFS) profile domain-containing protein n=1 Tax=Nasonia vitripennis TaxID=7425 RepID=A0A7M7QKH5_NASVI|nr:carcinine transporter isoform X3 [Nasonia vitripennis]
MGSPENYENIFSTVDNEALENPELDSRFLETQKVSKSSSPRGVDVKKVNDSKDNTVILSNQHVSATQISADKDMFDLDDLLPILGEFGRYQKQLLWFICLPACLPCGFCAFNQLFMSNTPSHWCNIPELGTLNMTMRKIIAIPTVGFDLVCDYDIYPTIGLVALNAGGPVGVYMFGSLNDRFGRRLSFFACLATLITGASLSATANTFWIWAATRIIVGLTIPAIYQIPFIISLELVGPNYRSFVTVMTCTFYTMGLCMLAGVTYYIQEWRTLALVTSLPFSIYFLYWW